MTGNPYELNDEDSRDYEAFLEQARKEMVPKLSDSQFAVSICPVDPTKLDMKFSMELGCMIMLDKPIIAVVSPGSKVPDHLVRVADEIVEVDLNEPLMASQAINDAVGRLAERFGIDDE